MKRKILLCVLLILSLTLSLSVTASAENTVRTFDEIYVGEYTNATHSGIAHIVFGQVSDKNSEFGIIIEDENGAKRLFKGQHIGAEGKFGIALYNVPDGFYNVYAYSGDEANRILAEKTFFGVGENWESVFLFSNGTITGLTGYGMTLKEIIIPSTIDGNDITSIGDYAFYNCESITSIKIPNSVTSIGKYAFASCDSLTSVTFEGNSQLTSIGGCAFQNCLSLTSVTFEENTQLTSIGNGAFSWCESLISIEIPNSVTSICDSAFYHCCSLTSVTFEGNSQLTSMGYGAFASCYLLTSIEIPKSVTKIGAYAFIYCDNLVIYCEAESKPSEWDDNWNPDNRIVVWDCQRNRLVTFDGDGGTLVSGEEEQIIAHGGSAVAPTYEREGYTFAGWDTDFSVVASDLNVKAIWKINQYTITLVYGNGQGNKIITQDYNSVIEDIANPERVGYYFAGWDKTIPTQMPAENVTINANWEEIFVISKGSIVELTQRGRTLSDIIIPSTIDGKYITSIGDYAFYNCESLTSIEIPGSVTSIGDGAFYECYLLRSIDVAEDNSKYKDIDGNLYSKDGTVLIQYAIGKIASTFKIPSSVTSIGNGAFSWSESLTSIGIPNSVTSIGFDAFYNCIKLRSIEIPNGVTSIGFDAFTGCNSLTYNKKYGIKYLGNSTNEYLYLASPESKSLTIAYIDSNCRLIGDYAFYQCYSLTSVTFEENSQLTSIGDYAFAGCDLLTSIKILDSVTSIGNHAFEFCESLTSIEIPKSVVKMGESVFEYCYDLRIYCEAESIPSEWDVNWNPNMCQVVLKYPIKR